MEEPTRHDRLVDKSIIPVCTIMGVNIAAINMEWLVAFTKEHIKELSGDYMCVSNVHTTVMSYDDETYCAVQNGGIMAIPDGGPLSSVGRKRGFKTMQRTTGPDYMNEIFQISAENHYKHFFYGAMPETLDILRNKLTEKYPGIEIAGMYSPPYRELTDAEDAEVIRIISGADADFVWVGLGAPKQERWMAQHQWKVKGFMVGVGAGFDYFAEKIKRAPKWMQKCNLEWLYRLFQEPKRLFKRYFYSNPKFIWHAMIRKR